MPSGTILFDFTNPQMHAYVNRITKRQILNVCLQSIEILKTKSITNWDIF